MCIIIENIHQFIGHCLIPLDPWNQPHKSSFKIKINLQIITVNHHFQPTPAVTQATLLWVDKQLIILLYNQLIMLLYNQLIMLLYNQLIRLGVQRRASRKEREKHVGGVMAVNLFVENAR